MYHSLPWFSVGGGVDRRQIRHRKEGMGSIEVSMFSVEGFFSLGGSETREHMSRVLSTRLG